MKKILFITNGHGEDLVAARIIKELPKNMIAIDVMPVVGRGEVFKGLDVKVIGPKNLLPGGGFGLRNYGYLLKDIFAGLIKNTYSQIKTLMNNKFEYSLVVGVGDAVPIVYSILTGCKFIIIGVNKSEYYRKLAFNYIWAEKAILKKHCLLLLSRDEHTASSLRSFGINAEYVGNPMMDLVKKGTGDKPCLPAGRGKGIRKDKTIGFLPGTREDAYKNIEDFFKVAWQIRRLDKNIKFILSLPPTLDKKRYDLINKPFDIPISRDFYSVLNRSNIIIGLSGTGNEQAAGLGLPVIAFPGRGAQFNSRFAHGQKELLGNSLLLLPRRSELIAKEALALMHNKKRVATMGKAGKKRMGKPGASRAIAKIIIKEIRL